MQNYRGDRALRISGVPAVAEFIASASVRRDGCLMALLVDRDLYLVAYDTIHSLRDEEVRTQTIRIILEAKSLEASGIILVAERRLEDCAAREMDQRFFRDLRHCATEENVEVLDLININGREVTRVRPVRVPPATFADELAASASFRALWS